MTLRKLGLACALALSVLVPAHPGQAKTTVPHLEHCTRWGYIDQNQHFGTSNTCKTPVALRFQAKSSPGPVEHILKPGEAFDTGMTREQIGSGWWIFTTCPVGYRSDVAFGPANVNIIAPSHYRCVPK